MLISPYGFSKALLWRWRCFMAVANARRQSSLCLARGGATRVLVVCHGNIYRSPFVAEALVRRLRSAVEIRSAGFHATEGRASPEGHVAMSRARGVDLTSHRSVCISRDDLAWAEIIVLMDRHNWQSLRHMGAMENKLVWLGTLDGGSPEIPDPYHADPVTAQDIVSRLDACASRLAGILARSAPKSTASPLE